MTTYYDVIIIGTGAGGGMLAYALAPSGKRVLLLEGTVVTTDPGRLSGRLPRPRFSPRQLDLLLELGQHLGGQ
jgi:choline dehydrogenase-like flavoprotein